MERTPTFSVGHGYDLHRLERLPPHGQGKPLRLGGVSVEHHFGPVAKTDGDAVLHALTDAILSAGGLGSMGALRDSGHQAVHESSAGHFAQAVKLVVDSGWMVTKLDCTIILERPRIQQIVREIGRSVAEIAGLSAESVSVKVKTAEGLGPIGRGHAVEVRALALIWRA